MCGPRKCVKHGRDRAEQWLGLPPPRTALASSPPDPLKAWWELWAHIRVGVSGQRESQPVRILGTNRRLKIPAGPLPSWPRPKQWGPDDQVVLPDRLTVYCIVMCGNSGNIHFESGGSQPSLQPFLQKREHNRDRASTGVFPAGRTPINEQVPLQPVSMPCRRSFSWSDGVHYRWR